jgi:hypothetical protein
MFKAFRGWLSDATGWMIFSPDEWDGFKTVQEEYRRQILELRANSGFNPAGLEAQNHRLKEQLANRDDQINLYKSWFKNTNSYKE